MVPLVILPLVPLVAIVTIVDHRPSSANDASGTIGRANGADGIIGKVLISVQLVKMDNVYDNLLVDTCRNVVSLFRKLFSSTLLLLLCVFP